ncbi:MAG: TRAP transporter large permease [Phycisphaeraceae bacterium]
MLEITLVIVAIMLVLLLLGFPMKVPLLMSALVVMIAFFPDVDPRIMIQQWIGGITPGSLVAVPMFILAADVMTRGQAANRLLDAVMSCVGHLRGGLPITSAISCTVFGAISGSTQATVVAVGGPLRPRLLKAGYSDSFTSALIINASDIALLIPPSIGMIVYGVVAQVSIGDLFIAGIGPGLMILLFFCIYCYIASIRLNIPRLQKATTDERNVALKRALWPLGFPIIIIGGIYGGFFSPTEAAAISVGYAVLLETVVFRELKMHDLRSIALNSGLITAVVFVLVGAGAAFSWVISFAELPGFLISLDETSGYWTILLTIAVAYFIGCMFVDPIVVILILTPIFAPIAAAAGIDPILVGVIVTMQVAIGSATPPFGCDIFTAIAIFRRPYLEVIRGTPPFIAILLVSALLVMIFPQIALGLGEVPEWLSSFFEIDRGVHNEP